MPWIQGAVMADHVFGVARHVEHSRVGPRRGNLVGQFTPVHARHDDVGQQQVNGTECGWEMWMAAAPL